MTVTIPPPEPFDFALAMIMASATPLLMLDGNLVILAGSKSFCGAFQIDPAAVNGNPMAGLGSGEWDIPQLDSLLRATANGFAEITDYELKLKRSGRPTRDLLVNAHKVANPDGSHVRVLVSVADITEARLNEKLKDDLLRDKAILLLELQHRVANSLQIIASVLMQSARKVQSEESRTHLYDAHNRVMSIATLQKQLAASASDEVSLRPYLTDLCRSIGASMIQDRNLVSLEVAVDETIVKADISISIGLVVTELVINALKHAFTSQGHGNIVVSYKAAGSGWSLSVSDDGIGMADDHPKPKAGLGTNIVQALAAQLDADIEVTNCAPGTRVSLSHRHQSDGDDPPLSLQHDAV
ncbi:ATP-binding protein [Neorhizobium galegae]|uniref:sensor histidine kinase n=1 Tax=Neorhizobium galegae TaxID=399 RepID=UPI0006226A66|nr:PAS domain-containing sensor histidine kinase [Neorhizobium galegae]CDZ28718.1 Sensory transduction regulatory protein [Neorhizobium galegae bv. officinalis]KAB1110898.1 PAS domain-containing protein [Neorhizobium galegae]MCQ1768098.1 ATP-binding protein [Neorhizobium galegae]MCQ1775903.1 ATP-binding protein [Neorhizobium galegae]MCQ1797921.1 ATP-binding protein [Neorhizobium galegae]